MNKRLLPEICGLLIFPVLLELLIRLTVPTMFIERGIWYNSAVAWKFAALAPQADKVALLFVGDSTVFNSIDPYHFDREVYKMSGQAIYSFNGAFPAANAKIVSFYSRSVYPGLIHPKAIIYILSPESLLSRSSFYTEAVAAYDSSLMESNLRDTSSQVWHTVDHWLWAHSTLYRIRGSLRQFFTNPVGWLAEDHSPFDARGYSPTTSSLAHATPAASQEMHDYFRKILAYYTVDPALVQDMDHMIEDAQQKNIKVYLAVSAVTPYLLDAFPGGSNDYDKFVNVVRKVARHYSVPMFYLDRTHWADYFSEDDYQDYWHTNDKGAQIFTRMLADWYSKNTVEAATF